MRKTGIGDFAFSFLANILNFGIGIILLPLVLKFLSASEVGLWYVFMAVNGLVLLFDAALSPSLARNGSYAFAGIEKLQKNGVIAQFSKYKAPNYVLLEGVFRAGKSIYGKISVISLTFLLSFGSIYIYIVSKDILEISHTIAWFVFVLGIFFNLKFGFWPSLLSGIGCVKEGQIAIICSKVMQLFITSIGLFLFKSILVLSVSFLLCGFILRWVSSYYYNKFVKKPNSNISTERIEINIQEIKEIVYHNSKKVLLWSLGNYVIANFGLFFITYKFNLVESAHYSITIQLFSVLVSLCSTVAYTYVPEVNKLVVNDQKQKIKEIISRSILFSIFSFVLGAIVIYFFAQPLLGIIKSNVFLLDKPFLIAISVIILLEMIHSECCVFITTFNYVPFAKSALLSGFLVILLTMLSFLYFKNLWAVLFARGVVQLAFNNWFWPKRLWSMLSR